MFRNWLTRQFCSSSGSVLSCIADHITLALNTSEKSVRYLEVVLEELRVHLSTDKTEVSRFELFT